MTTTTLKKKQIRIIPQGPLMIGDASGVGFYEQTVDHIPGSVVRGAVAARLLERCTQPAYKFDHAACPDRDACSFWQVFGVSGWPRFGHCYAAQRSTPYPFPATARTCKRFPGFPDPDSKDEPPHGVFDTLIAQFVFELLSDPRFPHRETLQPALREEIVCPTGIYDPLCPECERGVAPASGVYLVAGQQIGFARQPAIRRATHVGINRARGVAEDGLLFTQETIRRGDVAFWGEVVADESAWPTLGAALAGAHVIGRGRSRGLGAVEMFVQSAVDTPTLSERVKEFNYKIGDVLYETRQADARIESESSGTFFSLTLRTPAILAHAGMPQTRPEPANIGVPEAVRLRSWARTTVVGGWNTAARWPHRTRLAVQAGGVYLFYAPPEVEEEALVEQLDALELQGIGLWRERGFGQVTVCAPFHFYGWGGDDPFAK